jgi:dimethylargininase
MIERAPKLPIVKRIFTSVITALAVAAVVHVVTVLVFFISGQAAAGTLGRFNELFLPASLVALAVFAVFAFFGTFQYWFSALPTGLVAGIVAAVLGTVIYAAARGVTVDGSVLPAVLATLGGANLIFVVAAIVAAGTVGTAVWAKASRSRLLGAARPGRRIALVRLPAANLDEGQVTHIERRPINADLADDQWDGYLAAFTENDWTVVEVAPEPELADSVFIEDTMVVFGRTAVIANPGSESRRAEIEGAEAAARDLGLRVERITAPGTLDGGDVLKVGRTVFVGRGGRTNADGIRQLRSIASRLGYTVVAVPVTKVLHLKSAVTALPDGTVIGYPPLVDDPGMFERFLAMPEETGSHVVVLSDDTVLMAASAPRSAELITELGYRVVTVDISEYEKLEGCVTCLSVRVR